METEKAFIKVIIGLGNPGAQYYYTRHSIGFRIVDELAQQQGALWKIKDGMQRAEITMHDRPILLVKSQTYMNDSGKVIPPLLKQGIKPEEIVVIHDELEKPFGSVQWRLGGSHRGHNGLRSLMQVMGPDFYRIRVGIGRPVIKEDVADYVLQKFTEPETDIEKVIAKALEYLEMHMG